MERLSRNAGSGLSLRLAARPRDTVRPCRRPGAPVRVIVGRSWRCCSASRARTRSPLARSRPRGPPNRWSATRTLAPGTCHETINSPLLAANLAAAFVTAWSDNDGVANAPDSLHATIGTAGGALAAPRTIASGPGCGGRNRRPRQRGPALGQLAGGLDARHVRRLASRVTVANPVAAGHGYRWTIGPPSRPPSFPRSLRIGPSADVAQLVERRLPKPKVAGSRPVVRFHGLAAPRRNSPQTLHFWP
jgi:hypothetical protein